MKRLLILLAAIPVAASLLSAATITDGDFTNWGLSVIGPASMTLEGTGGNPGPRLNVTTTTLVGGPAAYGLAINNNIAITEALTGTFTLSLDVLSGAGDFGAGQSVGLLVQQGSDIYEQSLNITGCCFGTFNSQTFTGTFSSVLFSHYVGAGAATPDFSGATSTLVGFVAINSSNNRTLTQYYDNFSLTYSSAAPEPGTWVMLLTGLAGCVIGLRRVRA